MRPAAARRNPAHLALSMGVAASLAVVLVGMPTSAHAAGANVTTEAELSSAFAAATTTLVTLGTDITVAATILPVASTAVVLDLNGHTLNTNSIVIASGSSLTVQSSGIAAASGELNAVSTGTEDTSIPAIAITSATLTVDSGTVNVSSNAHAAAIGGLMYNNRGGTVVVNGGTVNATTTGQGSAIGGSAWQNDFGSITINGGTVNAQSSGWGAAGLGGANGGFRGRITIAGGEVNAVAAGSDSAAISSGSGVQACNTPLTVITISGGTVVAESGSGGAAIGGGEIANGAEITIGKDARVTVLSTARTAIGGGPRNYPVPGDCYTAGSLTIAGEVTVATGQLALFANETTTVESTGIIQGAGSISGSGTITNDGAIRTARVDDATTVSGGLTINGHNYLVNFDANFTAVAPDAAPESDSVRVFAKTFADGGRTVPVLARAGWSVEGFYSAVDGSGPAFSTQSAITADTTVYAQWLALAVTPSAPATPAGGAVTFTTVATSSAAPGSSVVTGATTLTTDDPDAVITGNSIVFHKAGVRTVTATYGSAVETILVTVAAGPLSSFTLTPSAPTIAAGDTVTLATEGFDVYGNSLGTLAGQIGYERIGGNADVSADFQLIKAGVETFRVSLLTMVNGTLTPDLTPTLFATASVTVVPDSLVVGLLTTATSQSIVAGGSVDFTVQGFDLYSNDKGDQTSRAVFTSEDPTDVVSGSRVVFFKAGLHKVHVTVGNSSQMRLVTVAAGPASQITVIPSATTVTAGDSLSFTAAGTDVWGNDLGDITSTTAFDTGNPADVVQGGTIIFHTAGPRTITATNANGVASVTVTVAAGALATITLDPSSATATAGDTRVFTVQGFDAQGNTIGDVTSTATFASDNAKDAITGNSVRFSKPGSHTITATVTTTVGRISATSTVDVTPGTPASISITPSATTVVAGNSLSFITMQHDSEGNDLGDLTSGTSLRSTDSTDGVVGNTITFTTAGTHTITANNAFGIFTVDVTVAPGPLASLAITPNAATVTSGLSTMFTVEGFDSHGNSVGDVTSRATVTSDILRDTVAGNSVTFANVGSHTITATVNGLIVSSTITVTAGPLASVNLTPSAPTVTAGDSVDFVALGFDNQGNDLGDVSSTTTIASDDPTDSVDGTSVTFHSAGQHTITATNGLAAKTASVTVRAGVIASISVDPVATSITAGGTISFTVDGFDAFANPVGDVTSTATFASDTARDTIVANDVRFSISGAHTITASVGAITHSIRVDVVAGPLATITTVPSATTVIAGQSLSFATEGFDGEGNSRGDVSATTVLTTNDSTDTVTGSSIALRTAGVHSVTATKAGISNAITVTVTVDADSPDAITLTASDLTVALGGSITVRTSASDEYGNIIGDVTDQITLSSDYSSDQIVGNTVTFPHASPHVITATLGTLSTSITVEVVAPATSPTGSPVAPTTSLLPSKSLLPSTGTDAAPILLGGLLLLGIGMLALLITARRRRAHR